MKLINLRVLFKAVTLLMFGSCRIAVGERNCAVVPVPIDVKAVPSADSASITVTWGWKGNEFHCVRRTVVVYRVPGNNRKEALRINLNTESATNYTLQNLMCNNQYIIFVKSVTGMDMGRESNETTAVATCRGTPGSVTAPTIPTGGEPTDETSSSVRTTTPTGPTGGEPTDETSSSVPTTTPTGPTDGEPTDETSSSVPTKPTDGEPTDGSSSSVPTTTATPNIPTGGEPQSGRPSSAATTTHGTPTGGEPSNGTASNGTAQTSGTHSAPLIGTAAVLAGAVLLVALVITILVVGIRWHKLKKKGHIPVELADIHAACEPDSDSESDTARATDVDNDYYEAVKITTSGVPIVSWSNGTHQITMINEEGSATKRVVHVESKQEVQSSSAVESKRMEVAKFGEYVSSLHALNNAGFQSQYRALPSGESGQSIQVAKNNQTRNRFRNIVTYDHHHITLNPITTHANCRHNYINASYIDGYFKPQKYIATQGPLPNTVTDIWRLVWQEKVKVIVMITKVVEGGQRKCEQYWPDQEPQEYGPFTVTLADQQVFADYIIRTLQVKKGDSLRRVIQFHFTTWPDHGVPEYAGTILTFLRRVNAQHMSSKGPLLIHCSAGVGRTGTLITIDMALELAAKKGTVDIPAIVSKIRRQRMKMVQTVDQYSFIHDAVLEFLICGNTQIVASDLKGAIEDMEKRDNQSMKTRFQMEFLVLGQVSPRPTEVVTTATRYPQKNRSSEFLPDDKWRVILKAGTPDYINASFANGYKQYKEFIVTQAPMKTTCQDFWKMVFERKCGLIVMLSDVVENREEVCHQYWPGNIGEKGTREYGEFSVSTLEEVNQDQFVQRLFSVTNSKSGHTHQVTQLQLGNWTPEGLCTSPKTIVDITDLLFAVQRRSGNKPVVVHGRDTVSRCGIFCAFINVVECCKTEGIVDVFQAVKGLRIQKPGSVLTVEQYRFIFDLVLLFLESFDIYSNFK